jgi:hypothetical protein
VFRKCDTEGYRIVVEEVPDLRGAQGTEGMDEAHPRIELRIPGESFLQARQPQQHHAQIAPIEDVPHLF